MVDPKRPNTLYTAVGATVIESDDGGDSWKTISHGGGSDDQALPGNHRVSSLAVDPSGAVFAAVPTDDGGIFKTTDAGATWTHVVSGVSVDHVAVDPRQPTTIYAVGTQWSGSWQTRPSSSEAPTAAAPGRSLTEPHPTVTHALA